ncbi:MAG: metal transporter [Proteobacteria bacterium]|nr:metal transporter [Pseudomonadota bacterium]
MFGLYAGYFSNFHEINTKLFEALGYQAQASVTYLRGMSKYLNEFMIPYRISQDAFMDREREKLVKHAPQESLNDYLELLHFNLQVAEKGYTRSLKSMNDYHSERMTEASSAWVSTLMGNGSDDIVAFAKREAKLLEKVVHDYPQAILDIEPEYGFHFDDGGYVKTVETDRFLLYQVLPQNKKIKVRKKGKPVIVIHPYVLGPNIVGFLPGEKKSFVHAYANQGTPTYVRIMKDISTNPAVQVMTGEDDALDTKLFCEQLKAKHGKQVTLNGFCQGGFIAMAEVLSGVLDGLVDAFITCVSPMDGTRSVSLVEYLEHLPPRFRDLGYAVKTLPNGNRVVDGKVMSWVYKLKSMEREAPIFTFYRDLKMFDKPNIEDINISKTAAAINYWLTYDRNDLPEAITKMSFDSYTIPVESDGTLPVKLFGKKLNFKRLQEKGVKLLICYAANDDLVDKATAIAPLDYIDAEVTEFPKGHGAIATSWSHPDSECALHTRFGDNYRGPVRFHLDLEAG